jgi:lipoprotein-anchoring transpeptidase ErfK/SrfK
MGDGMNRRGLLTGLFGLVASTALAGLSEAHAQSVLDFTFLRRNKVKKLRATRKVSAKKSVKSTKPTKKLAASSPKKAARPKRPAYAGASIVQFASNEKPGTIIIRTGERALYRVMGGGQAKRYLVAVGKEGFSWSGTARVGRKAENPTWTPPPEMIERTPQYAKWAGGMPGGLPFNPLGPRAMYLYNKSGDTGFRIHGTIHPESIGTAASSGCIRMLNKEVIDLYSITPRGTKVIVL